LFRAAQLDHHPRSVSLSLSLSILRLYIIMPRRDPITTTVVVAYVL
jgi:hypothetical protein